MFEIAGGSRMIYVTDITGAHFRRRIKYDRHTQARGALLLFTALPACFRVVFACFPFFFVVWCSVSTFYSVSTFFCLCAMFLSNCFLTEDNIHHLNDLRFHLIQTLPHYKTKLFLGFVLQILMDINDLTIYLFVKMSQ